MKMMVVTIQEFEVGYDNILGSVDKIVNKIEDNSDRRVLAIMCADGVSFESRQVFSPSDDSDDPVDMEWKWVPMTIEGGLGFTKMLLN